MYRHSAYGHYCKSTVQFKSLYFPTFVVCFFPSMVRNESSSDPPPSSSSLNIRPATQAAEVLLCRLLLLFVSVLLMFIIVLFEALAVDSGGVLVHDV